MSVSVSTTAGTQVTVTVDGATRLSFTTEESSISVVNGDTSSISVTNQGPKGDTGATGPQGPAGQGVPTGGDQFQVLRKVSGTDYDTEWDYADRITLEVRFDEAVSKGDPLYITGFNNGQNRITVAKADASDSSKMPSIGLAFSDYSQNDNGQATAIGSLDDVNTQQSPNDFQEGDVLYVKSGGGLTNVKPTGTNLIQNVGKVGRRQQNNGEIVVMAIGRSNDIPNIPDGQIWIGNASGVATPTAFGVDLDSTPQLGGDLDVNGNKIVSASNGDIVIDPNGTGAIIFKSDDIQFDGDGGLGTGKIRLYESDVLGSNFIALAAPLSVTSDTTLILPDGDGSFGQVLSTNGAGTLSWADVISSLNPDFTGYLDIRPVGSFPATLFFYDLDGSNYVSFKVPDVVSSDVAFVLPGADGSAGQVLKTDGSGNLSFVDQTTDTNTNLGNSDQTLSAERTIDLSGNALVIDNNSTEVARIFSNGYIQATGRSIVKGNGTVGGEVRMNDADNTNYVGIKSPAVVSSNLTFTLPDSDGSADQFLKTDGSGNLSFTDISDPILPLANISGRYQWASTDDGERIFTGNTSYGPFNWYSFTAEPGQADMRTYSGSEVAGTTSVSMSSYLIIAYGIKNPFSGKKVRVDYDFRIFGSPAVTANTPFGFSVWSANAATSGTSSNTTYTYRGESSDHAVSTSSIAHHHGSFTTSAAIEDDHILVLPEHRDSTGINGTTYMYANFAVYMVD